MRVVVLAFGPEPGPTEIPGGSPPSKGAGRPPGGANSNGGSPKPDRMDEDDDLEAPPAKRPRRLADDLIERVLRELPPGDRAIVASAVGAEAGPLPTVYGHLWGRRSRGAFGAIVHHLDAAARAPPRDVHASTDGCVVVARFEGRMVRWDRDGSRTEVPFECRDAAVSCDGRVLLSSGGVWAPGGSTIEPAAGVPPGCPIAAGGDALVAALSDGSVVTWVAGERRDYPSAYPPSGYVQDVAVRGRLVGVVARRDGRRELRCVELGTGRALPACTFDDDPEAAERIHPLPDRFRVQVGGSAWDCFEDGTASRLALPARRLGVLCFPDARHALWVAREPFGSIAIASLGPDGATWSEPRAVSVGVECSPFFGVHYLGACDAALVRQADALPDADADDEDGDGEGEGDGKGDVALPGRSAGKPRGREGLALVVPWRELARAGA